MRWGKRKTCFHQSLTERLLIMRSPQNFSINFYFISVFLGKNLFAFERQKTCYASENVFDTQFATI